MIAEKKIARYQRLHDQINTLIQKSDDPLARMSTVAAVLYHKMNNFFWVGFYLLRGEKLIVGPYQGPVACMILPPHTGVCWKGIDSAQSIIVADVHAFPGHIACDSRALSEIVVPLRNGSNKIVGVLDVDSDKLDSFDELDREWLEKIVALIYA